MSLIIKDHSGFLNSSVNMINRKPRPQNIVFCDKDDISFIQRIVFLTGICQICIKQAAIVASTFFTGAPVTALDFNIVCTVVSVYRQNVQPNRTSLQIFNAVLSMNLSHNQIVSLQNDSEQELCAVVVFKHRSHKIIINQTKLSNPLQIFFVLPFKIQFLLCFSFRHWLTSFLFTYPR